MKKFVVERVTTLKYFLKFLIRLLFKRLYFNLDFFVVGLETAIN